MTVCRDSSAIVAVWIGPEIRMRLHRAREVTRTHGLAGVFPAVAGGHLTVRPDAGEAARRLAHGKGRRGGRGHDCRHAVATDKIQATKRLAVDHSDCDGISAMNIEQLGW